MNFWLILDGFWEVFGIMLEMFSKTAETSIRANPPLKKLFFCLEKIHLNRNFSKGFFLDGPSWLQMDKHHIAMNVPPGGGAASDRPPFLRTPRSRCGVARHRRWRSWSAGWFPGEQIDRALKRFKKKFLRTGTLKQLRSRKQFTKKSVILREQKLKAAYSQKLIQEEE